MAEDEGAPVVEEAGADAAAPPPEARTTRSLRGPQAVRLCQQEREVLAEARRIAGERAEVAAGEATAEEATAEEARGGPTWSIRHWLDTCLTDVLADALRAPVAAEGQDLELAFMKALVSKGSEELVQEIFRRGNVLARLSAKVMELAGELEGAKAATAEELNSKFADEEGVLKFSYGRTAEFFSGLEELIGAPSPKVIETMEHEHCTSDDSRQEWTTKNYGITTQPIIEWNFVKKPHETPAGGWPKETKNTGHPRQPKSLDEFRAKFKDVNDRLARKGEPTIMDAEWIGSRLYTGPMFEKYNAVLRGGLLIKDDDAVTCGAPASGLQVRDENAAGCTSPTDFPPRLSGTQSAFFKKQFDRLCHGNRYVTSIHAINSALIKLSKLERAARLYRGMVGGVLPECFWQEGEDKVRGGVEFGFLSTSRQKTVAQQYMQDGTCPTLIEIQTGMVDRGADLSPFSQYEHEEEICFPPLTCLEVLRSRVDGCSLVLEMRLNVNFTSLTIERVITKRHKIVENICDQLYLETRRALQGDFWKQVVPDENHSRYIGRTGAKFAKSKLKAITDKNPESFNNDVVLLSSVKRALNVSDSIKWMKSTVLMHAADTLQSTGLQGFQGAIDAAKSAFEKANRLKDARGVKQVDISMDDIRKLNLTGGSSTGYILEALKLEDRGGLLRVREASVMFPGVEKGFELIQVNNKRGVVNDMAREIVAVGGARLEFLQCLEPDVMNREVLKILRQVDRAEAIEVKAMEIGRLMALNAETRSLDLRGPFRPTPEQEAEKISPEAGEAMMKALEMNWTIETLLLCNNAIGARTALVLGACLKNNHTLRTLNIGNNRLGPGGGKGVAEVLEASCTIDTLRVRENNLGPEGGKAVAMGLKRNQSLQVLYIERNGIGEEGAKAFAEGLLHNDTLQAVHIDGNNLGPAGCEAIAKALETNRGLVTLWMEKNAIGEVGGKAIARTLHVNTTLTQLGLGNNAMGASGSIGLAHALEANNVLTILHVGDNGFGDGCGKAFGVGLGSNKSLRVLRMQNNGLGAEAACAVARALTRSNLQRLSLDENDIEIAGATALAEAIESDACTLQMLDVRRCALTTEAVARIARGLEKARLVSLQIQENKLGDDGGKAIAEAVAKGRGLQTLKMQDNMLTSGSVDALVAALERSRSLKKLELNGDFGEEGMAAIGKAWESHGRKGGLEWKNSKG